MQQLYIKQKLLTVSERFTVTDAAQNVRYYVAGSFMSIPKTFSITNPGGFEVARIEKKVFSWLPHFDVYIGGRPVAAIDKEFTLFKPRYRIDAQGIAIDGDWWDLNFTVLRGGMRIAQISQRWLSWGDTYEVSVYDDRAEILIVALVIAIDKVKNDDNSNTTMF